MNYSIIRNEEYRLLAEQKLDGRILDVGGSKRSGYHQLITGQNEFTVINIDKDCEPDFFVDIEKKFPFDDASFDHAVCLNVLEHVFEFENVFSEQLRCVKKGGYIILAAPFMHFIHGSPDDYLRYTDSAYRRLAAKYNVTIEKIVPMGGGIFSLVFQFVGGSIPTDFLRNIFKKTSVFFDRTLNKISRKYRKLSARIPLGFFVVVKNG